MNWWYLLGWDFGQQIDLNEQSDQIAQLKRELQSKPAAATTESELERLRLENAELKLYVASIFQLLRSKGIATEDELRRLISLVDGADGQMDNTFRGDVVTGRAE